MSKFDVTNTNVKTINDEETLKTDDVKTNQISAKL